MKQRLLHLAACLPCIACMVAAPLFSAHIVVPLPMSSDARESSSVHIVETSAAGHALTAVRAVPPHTDAITIRIDTGSRHQTILGFGDMLSLERTSTLVISLVITTLMQ